MILLLAGVVGVALAVAGHAASARAAQVVSDGFESGLGGWVVTTGGDGTFALQGAEVATGSSAARWSVSANTGSLAYARRSVGAPLTDITVTFAGRVDTEGVVNSNVPLLRLLSGASARIVYVYRQNAASNRLYVSYNGGFFQTTGTLPLGAFARFSLHVIVNGAASTVVLAKDGAVIYSTTTASLGTAPIQTLQLGNETAKQIGTAVIDDVVAFDATGSDTLITGGPAGPTASAAPAFSFSSPDAAATFQCNLDGGAYAACTSPKAYGALADGPHTFDARAVDAAGYVDPTPATRAFTVDTAAPDTSITSGPTGTVTSTSATFAFTSPDATATFQCSLDGAGFAACASPQTYAGLSDGDHAFQVRALDAAGNVDAAPASRAWTVASGAPTPPDTAITGGPSGTVADTSASFAFSSPDGSATFECALDGAAFGLCASPTALTGLADGSHTFEVRAVNAAGPDPTPASRTWTVDTTPPDTSIDSGPNGTVTTSSVSFTFSSPDAAATFACSLDTAPFTSCTSPQAYSALANGAHTFKVEAIDGAGNVDPTPATGIWTVNVTSGSPPDTSIDSGPSGTVASATATFTFASTDPSATFECNRDGTGFAACTSPLTYAGLADGAHTLLVRATNAAGPDATPASRTWTVDTTAPDTTITAGPSGPTPGTSATFAFTSPDGAATFQCSLDGVTFATCASPATYSTLADGQHTFQVRAVDAVGNADATSATRSFTVDTVAPSTVIDTGPSGTVGSASATFTFHSPDTTATFQCRVDGGSFAACTSPTSLSGLANGTHTFGVRAVDPAGNADPAPPARTWTVNVSGGSLPTTTITGGPSGTVNTSTVTFTFTSDDVNATFECSLDNALFSGCATPKTYSGLAQGAHTFQVRAVNGVGVDATPDTRSFAVDTVSPAITARTPAPGSNDAAYTTAVTATFSTAIAPATLTTSTFTLTRNGTAVAATVAWNAGTSTATLTPTAALAPNATYVATVVGGSGGVADPAGNALPSSVTWSFATPAQIVGAGDIADCAANGGQAQTEALLAALPGDVFADGDNVYPHGSAADFSGCYDPSWGKEKARTHPVAGNHDVEIQDGLPYYQYFGDAAGVPWAGYYGFDLGAWHVVVLNSNCSVIGCGAGSAQETWLRNDLAAHPTACTLALWHHPRYSSGGNGSSTAVAALYQALYDYGADVLVVGHDHDYERFNPQGNSTNLDNAFGIREFVVGTGGETTGLPGSRQPNSVVMSKSWGVIKLVLHPTGYDWQFVPVAGSTFADSGHGDCHGAPSTPPAPAPYFADGFESGLSSFTVKTGGDGAVAIGTGTVRTGTHALQLSAGSGSTAFADARRSLAPALAQVTASTDFRVIAQGASGGNVPALRFLDSGGNAVASIYRVNGTGEVWLKYGSATVKISSSLPLATWSRLTVHLKVGATGAGVVDAYKDGIKAFSTTTATLGTSPIATVQLGNDTTAQAFASLADNVAITAGGP